MSVSSWFPWIRAQQHKGRSHPTDSPVSRRRRTRLACDQLEDRTVPSNFTAATVSDLIGDINTANALGGSNTVELVAGQRFTLAAPDKGSDIAYGVWCGLPAISANDILTIQGNGDIIERSAGAPNFRLFAVLSGASLTVVNATLQGGVDSGAGGAIYNQGTLDLKGVTLTGNRAAAVTAANPAMGGAIYSSGSLTLEAGTLIQGNQAVGGPGTATLRPSPRLIPGGAGMGGGVYIASGTATLANVTLSDNSAVGGSPQGTPLGMAPGGPGLGGGLYVAGGRVTLTNDTVSSNNGGGLYIDSHAKVFLDFFTLNHTTGNTPDDIYGSYTLIA